VPLLIYMGFMWYLSSKPPISSSFFKFPFADKLAHFAEYLLFGYLLARALSPGRASEGKVLIGVTVAFLALVWGFIDELHQSFIPMRDVSSLDIVADCIGAAAGGSLRLLTHSEHGELGNKV